MSRTPTPPGGWDSRSSTLQRDARGHGSTAAGKSLGRANSKPRAPQPCLCSVLGSGAALWAQPSPCVVSTGILWEWCAPWDVAAGLQSPLPAWDPAVSPVCAEHLAPPSSHVPLCCSGAVARVWGPFWGSCSHSREKGSAFTSRAVSSLLLSPCAALLHPSPYPTPGRRAQQPLRADQPQPTGLDGSPGSFLGDVPVIPHLPAPSADRIHHGNPWAAHPHLQLLRLGAHSPHSAGAAAPGLHSASPASKDTRGHPQSCQARDCWGVGPSFAAASW